MAGSFRIEACDLRFQEVNEGVDPVPLLGQVPDVLDELGDPGAGEPGQAGAVHGVHVGMQGEPPPPPAVDPAQVDPLAPAAGLGDQVAGDQEVLLELVVAAHEDGGDPAPGHVPASPDAVLQHEGPGQPDPPGL